MVKLTYMRCINQLHRLVLGEIRLLRKKVRVHMYPLLIVLCQKLKGVSMKTVLPEILKVSFNVIF